MDKRTSMKNYKDVPSNATIKEERIKCGKSCLMCPHGPYYYAYWKDESGKLKKKYIGADEQESRLTHAQSYISQISYGSKLDHYIKN